MSARENLIRSVYSKLSQNQMEELVDAYAHELAEKQRAAEAQWRQSGYEGTRPKGWLIDLIDPEVSE